MASIDLLVEDDDIVLSSIGEPSLVSGVNCVAQDLRHMIREKGYAWKMIAERNRTTIQALCTEIEIEMEDDDRVSPGSASVTLTSGKLICNAETLESEAVSFGVSI